MNFLQWYRFFRAWTPANGPLKSAVKAARMVSGRKSRPHPRHWT